MRHHLRRHFQGAGLHLAPGVLELLKRGGLAGGQNLLRYWEELLVELRALGGGLVDVVLGQIRHHRTRIALAGILQLRSIQSCGPFVIAGRVGHGLDQLLLLVRAQRVGSPGKLVAELADRRPGRNGCGVRLICLIVLIAEQLLDLVVIILAGAFYLRDEGIALRGVEAAIHQGHSRIGIREHFVYGVASVLVANRTFDSARALASQFGGRAIRFEDLYETGHLADIVITATGAQSAIFRREHGELFLRRRKRRPMFFIDLAVPRNVDPDLDELDGMFVYNIDALQTVASVNAQKRQREAERAEAIITGEVARFYSRLEARSVVPTIVSLRRHFESIRQSELQRLHGRLGNLTVAQEAAIESLTRGILNKLIHAPLRALKVANESERQSMVKLLNFVYNLEDSSPSLPLPCTDPLGSAAANREPRESEAA